MHSPPLTHTKSSRKTRAQTRADLVPSSNVLPAALPLSVTAKASKPTRQRRQPQRRQLALPTSASNRRPESEESVQSHSSEENSSLTALTESNLRSLGRAAAKDLPVSLKQLPATLRPPTPPSVHLAATSRSSSDPDHSQKLRSRSLTEEMTPATGNSLHGRPLKFSRDLQISGRAYDYTFYDLAVNTDATESRTVADRLPSNIGLIESRIDAPRHDTPSALQFHRFLQKLSKAMRTGSAGAARETALVACFTSFLGSSLEDGSCDLSATQVWSGLIDLLPLGHNQLIPDLTIGLDPYRFDSHAWILEKMPGFTDGIVPFVNGVVEIKTSEGSLSKARIQNRGAAYLACLDWERCEDVIFHEPRSSLGTASVGSVAFDGNMIEASVHWLDRRPEPAPPDQLTVFSCRVAAGIVFATNLADFQETHRVFANFLDWLRDVRKLRFDRLKKMSYVDPDPPPAVEVAAHEPEPILEPGIEKAKGKKRKQAPEEKGSEAEGGKVKAAGTKARRTRLWDK